MWAVVVVFGFSLLGLTTGVHFSRRITTRRRYFEDCILLINSLVGEFRFKQGKLVDVLLGESERFNRELKQNIQDFVCYICGKTDTLELNLSHCNKREKSIIVDMFSVLGTYDLDTQVMVLENFKHKISEFYESEKQRESRYCTSYVKLGILAGIAVGVLIV